MSTEEQRTVKEKSKHIPNLPETTSVKNSTQKKKIAILLASLLIFTTILLAICISYVSLIPDGDTWWMWVIWVIWTIVFTIGVIETYNNFLEFQAIKREPNLSYQNLIEEQTNRQAIQTNDNDNTTELTQ